MAEREGERRHRARKGERINYFIYLFFILFTVMESVIVTTRLLPHPVLEVEGEIDKQADRDREQGRERQTDTDTENRQTPTQRDRQTD